MDTNPEDLQPDEDPSADTPLTEGEGQPDQPADVDHTGTENQ